MRWRRLALLLAMALMVAMIVAPSGVVSGVETYKGKAQVQTQPLGKLDANCAFDDRGIYRFGDQPLDQSTAQMFTAQRSGTLTSAQAMLSNPNRITGDFAFEIRSDDGGPSDDVLAAATVDASSVPSTPAMVTATFADPARVEAGNRYALVFVNKTTGPGNITLRVQLPGPMGSLPCSGRVSPVMYVDTGDFAGWLALGQQSVYATYVTPSSGVGTDKDKKDKKDEKGGKKHGQEARGHPRPR